MTTIVVLQHGEAVSASPYSRPSTPYQSSRLTSPDYDERSARARPSSGSPEVQMRPHARLATSPQQYIGADMHGLTGAGDDEEPERDVEHEQTHAALYRLLGIDMEQFLATHIDQYESEKKRWTGCSFEEWKAGAEGK